MRSQSSTSLSSPTLRVIPIIHGQITLDSFGIRVAVERGHLHLADGLGDNRRAVTLSRATCKLKRLAIIGHTGTISLEAVRWLSDVGVSLTVIDKDGALLLAHGPVGRDNAKLRRAQAIAPYTGAHVPIIRYLLQLKLAGQAANLARFVPDSTAIQTIQSWSSALSLADTCEALRACEANAANVYWESLACTPIRFVKGASVPEHWRTFGGRMSAITGSQRKAINPINAMLNYAYAILESVASIAIRAVGMDPGLGVLHADIANRDSLACDVMEVIRPSVDAFILDRVANQFFSAEWFHETAEGICRVLPPLTSTLADASHLWAHAIGPVVERVAQAFMDASLPAFGSVGVVSPVPASRAIAPKAANRTLPTLLTQRKRSEGRDGVRTKPRREPVARPASLFPTACRGCGTSLADVSRAYCDVCLPERAAEVREAWKAAGPLALAGTNHGGTIGRARGRTNAAHRKAMLAWEAVHGTEYDPTFWTTMILPTIQAIPVRKLAAATGLSHMYCALVKRGDRVPHPVQWDAFSRVGRG